MEIVLDAEPLESQTFLLMGLHADLLTDGLLTLSSSTGAAAQEVTGTYREELSCLASG